MPSEVRSKLTLVFFRFLGKLRGSTAFIWQNDGYGHSGASGSQGRRSVRSAGHLFSPVVYEKQP
jgi:hypothetical protein